MVMVNRKMLLANLVEAIWIVKLTANKKNQRWMETTSEVEKLLREYI